MEPKEYDKPNSHISTKRIMIYVISNNYRHPVSKTFTPLHANSLHLTQINLAFLSEQD